MNHVPLHGCVAHSFFTFLSRGVGMRLWEQLLDVNGFKTFTLKSLDMFQEVHYTEKLIILPSSHAMPLSLLFSIDSRLHTLLHVVQQFPHGSSTWIMCGHYTDYPRSLHRLSAMDRANIRSCLRRTTNFPCHVPYIPHLLHLRTL